MSGEAKSPRPGAAPEPPTHPDATKTSTVVVIGAGMSGLCAAKSLTNAGYGNVKIIEARDCIGGRTVTKEIGDSGVLVDAGAAWIHGTKDNPLIEICEHYGLDYVEHSEMKNSNAAMVDVTDDFERRAWTQEEVEALFPLLGELLPTLKPGVSALEGMKSFLATKSDLTPEQRQRAQFMMERIISGVAGPMNDVNVYYPVTKQTNRLAEGYDQLIAGGYNALTAKLAEGLDIELNCVVTKIEDTGNKKVAIKCEDGSKYEADYVVCSLPLGVLKSDAVKFEPALPEEMSAKLGRLEMGGFEKVILVFEDHFYKGWKENMDEFKDNKLIVNADMSKDGSSPFPLWIDISGKTTKPTVVCLYDGSFAKQVQGNKSMSDEDIVNEAIKYFAIGLGKSVDEIPKPIATMCTRWETDPYAYGAYSYFPLGSSPSDMKFDPIYDGKLMFCGEHTIAEHNASVHGPVISGLREARRLDKGAYIEKVIPGILPE